MAYVRLSVPVPAAPNRHVSTHARPQKGKKIVQSVPTHKLTHRNGVGQAERAAPRAPKDRPPLNPQVRPQPLDVGDEVPRAV